MSHDAPGRSKGTTPAAIAGVVMGLLMLATLGATSSLGKLGEAIPVPPYTPPVFTQTPKAAPASSIGTPPTRAPQEPMHPPAWLQNIVPYLITLVIVVAVLMMVWLVTVRVRGQRLKKATAERAELVVPPEPDEEQLLTSFDDSLERLRLGGAVDDAILECWRRLEQIAETAGIPRRPEQTATEFVVTLLATTPAPRDSLDELARLYREAMFSTHDRGEDDRERAISCLESLRDALTSGASR